MPRSDTGTQMTLAQRSILLVTAVATAGLVVACSSSDSPITEPNADCIPPTSGNFVDSTQGRVVMKDLAYSPEAITIRKGMSVRWVYCETPNSDAHTVTSDDGIWDSGLVGRGAVFTRTFAAVGSFAYHCIPHPGMEGVVTVVD